MEGGKQSVVFVNLFFCELAKTYIGWLLHFLPFVHRVILHQCEAVQVGKDVLRGNLVDGTITEFFDIALDDGPVGSDRVFFSNGSCGNRSRFWLLW